VTNFHVRSSRGARRIAAGLLIAGLAVAVTACSSGAAAPTASPKGAGTGELSGDIRFSWWGSDARAAVVDQVISQFEALHPKVKVSGEPQANFPDYWTQLSVEGAAKNVPCVAMQATTYLANYTTPSVLMPLNNLIKNGTIKTTGIPSSIINGGRANGAKTGSIYMIGTGASSTTLVWNTSMAKQYGIPALTTKMTWADYTKWLIAAQKKLPAGVNAIDLQGEWNAMDMLYAYARGNGDQIYVKTSTGYKLGITQKTLVGYLDWWQTLQKAGVTTTPAQASEEPTTAGDDYLAQRKVLVEIATSNLLADQSTLNESKGGTIAATYFPLGKAGTNGNVFDVSGPSIGADCQNLPAAAAFVNFWINDPTAVATFASNLGAVTNPTLLAPQLKSTTNDPAVTSSLKFNDGMLKANFPVEVHAAGYPTLITQLQTMTQNVQFGRQTPSAGAKSFISMANATLAQAAH
jgi:multiple sugar transport system substrate-binding protein